MERPPAESHSSGPDTLRSPPASDASSGLPRALTSFIGREHELAAIQSMLASDEVRLVTLTGPGGVGKTRLALKIAEQADQFADGISFVALASIRDPASVPSAIARAINVVPNPAQTVEQTVLNHLHESRSLLILDNIEQVLDAGMFVIEMLSACPNLTLIVTSRVNLRVSGEYVFSVSPLEVPGEAMEADLAHATTIPSLQLFVDRAHARTSTFELTTQNTHAVMDICRRLDGLPLALSSPRPA